MEDTLRESVHVCSLFMARLNPCSNGRYSQRWELTREINFYNSLNPCSNGRYSQRSVMFIRRDHLVS